MPFGRLRLAAWAATTSTTVGAASATRAAPYVPGGPRPALALVTLLAEGDGAVVDDVGVVVVRGGVLCVVVPPLVAVAAVSGVLWQWLRSRRSSYSGRAKSN